jgi:hypothetical protein
MELFLVTYIVEWDSMPIFDSVWNDSQQAQQRCSELQKKEGCASAQWGPIAYNAAGDESIFEEE